MTPRVGRSKPTIIRAIVVFPAPDCPAMAKRAARLKLEGDIVDGDELAILLAQPGCLQDRRAAAVRHRMPGEAGRVARGRGRTG